ncbi:MAG: helix-turn-helix transcriptional regulator [Lachnospiraceae bacterium]|nr:helix-turn-helix transcriptional regulator [Lachnospiraceae bacterium]
MGLSQNIKRLRLERKLTQEQLAAALGVSAQAVSKWETSDTYPDGELLVPLAIKLGVSLDELFGNNMVYMADISAKIRSLLHETEEKERFVVVRDIGWQMERGLFDSRMPLEEGYDPAEVRNQQNSSYILDDYGFSCISNGKEPFFSVFPEPEEGFGQFLEKQEEMQKIFQALSSPDTMTALLYLHRKKENYVFESSVLARECQLSADRIATVMEDLMMLRVVWKQELVIDGRPRILYSSKPSHKWIALFLMAQEVLYTGGYSLQTHHRSKPLLNR